MPQIQATHLKYKDQGLQVVGICLGDSVADARKYVTDYGYTWTHLYQADDQGSLQASPLALRFGVSAIPFKMLIGRDGALIATGGPLSEIQSKLEEALAQPAESGQPKSKSEAPPAEGS
jgi:hypothetical protein